MFSVKYAEFNSIAVQGHIRDTYDCSVKEAWVKSELELIGFIVTAGYLDEQCHNLVELNSAEFAQPLPASQVI